MPPSCRLGRFSDGDNTRSRRSNSRKKVYTTLCACVCTIPREKESWNGVGISEDWKFNLKRAEFSSSFSFSDRFDRIFDQERKRPFRVDPRSSLRRTTRGKRWRRYPGDVAAAFQMLYPRVIDHAPLHVYIFRSMGVRLSSNNTEYRFQPTLRTT